MTTQGNVRLALAEDRHAGALAVFYRAVWDSSATAKGVLRARAAAAASNSVDPGRVPPAFLALQDERVIGYVGSIPGRFWNGAEELPGYWIKGFMVLPEHRGGPIGYAVLREATRHLPRTAALVVALPARRLFGALGFKDLGAVPNFVRILRGGRMAARIDLEALRITRGPTALRKLFPLTQRTGLAWLGGGALGGLLRLRASVGRLSATGFRGETGLPGAGDLDLLWSGSLPSLRAGAVRDAREIAFRYAPRSDGEAQPYRVVSIRRKERLAGIAVVREPRQEGDPRLKGIALASLSDLWFDLRDSKAGLATLGAVEVAARQLGADALLCSTGHSVLRVLLQRQGYVEMGGNMHLLLRDVTESSAAWPPGLDQWWVSRGDAQSDDVF